MDDAANARNTNSLFHLIFDVGKLGDESETSMQRLSGPHAHSLLSLSLSLAHTDVYLTAYSCNEGEREAETDRKRVREQTG